MTITSPPVQPVPPAAETTASGPGGTSSASLDGAYRPSLVQDASPTAWPDLQPSLATQEVRLAVSFTGGVSLAVWMGGVARELNLLTQASELRHVPGEPDPLAGRQVPPLLAGYRKLLDLLDVQVCVDVLAGTSAGGINAALLGFVGARWRDLGPLRDIWLRAGDIGTLMRNPTEQAPPSLLKGDEQMLAALDDGIAQLARGAPLHGCPPPALDVFITTTYLSPETGRFADDFGTQVTDSDHHGLFHFPKEHLVADTVDHPDGTASDVKAALALAARSSASFPGAFEPSFVPGPDRPARDGRHPDMSLWSNATRSHWAADGGLLANRPIAPLLQTVFDRPADREVRRALLYVVPTTTAPGAEVADRQDEPLGLAGALWRDLGAALNQSISADLAAIAEHNDRVRSAGDTALRMAALANRLTGSRTLVDDAAWSDYRDRQSDWLVTPLIAEVSRELCSHGALPREWSLARPENQDAGLRAAARQVVLARWPADLPTGPTSLATAVALGRPAYDGARARMVRLLTLGRLLGRTREARHALAQAAIAINVPAQDLTRVPLRELVQRHVREALAAEPKDRPSLASVVGQVTTDFLDEEHRPRTGQAGDPLESAWRSLAESYRRTEPVLRRLAEDELERESGAHGRAPEPVTGAHPPGDGNGHPVATPVRGGTGTGTSLRERRRAAADELRVYLTFFGDEASDTIGRFLDLHVSVRSVLPVLTEVAQRVELIQVSADTPTVLAPHRQSAQSKLTGLQLSHFGAFYKPSWRANDWMWGRLDGCGRLVQLLLDPRRILIVLQNTEDEARHPDGRPASRAERFLSGLEKALGITLPRGAEIEDLSFLDDECADLPPSLPKLAGYVAAALQDHIVADELPVVARLVGAGQERSVTRPAPEIQGLREDRPPEKSLVAEKVGAATAGIRRALRERRISRLGRWAGRLHAAAIRTQRKEYRNREAIRDLRLPRAARPPTPRRQDQGAPTPQAQAWLSTFADAHRRPDWGTGPDPVLRDLLDSCPVPAERLTAEARARTPLFLRTATQAAAVATAAGTGMGKPPASLRPSLATLRTITRTAYLTAGATQGRRKFMALAGLVMLVVGIALMLTGTSVLGIGGLVVFAAGALALAFVSTAGVLGFVSLLAVLALGIVAAAPWLEPVGSYVFSWLSTGSIQFIHDNPWIWPLAIFLVLLPPLTTIADLVHPRGRPSPRGLDPGQRPPPPGVGPSR